MKLLAVMRPHGAADVRDAVAQRAREELRTLWDLYREDFVREMYLPGGPGAVLVLEAQSVEAASERLGELPLVADGIMSLELIELHPFGALGMLFQSE